MPKGYERFTTDELNAAVRGALPGIRSCFAQHGFPLSEPRWIDVAIDGTISGIVGAAADFVPRRPTLDACIAKTLEDACVKPFRPIRDSFGSVLGGGSFVVAPGRAE